MMFVQLEDESRMLVIINLDQIVSARQSGDGGWEVKTTDGGTHQFPAKEAKKLFEKIPELDP